MRGGGFNTGGGGGVGGEKEKKCGTCAKPLRTLINNDLSQEFASSRGGDRNLLCVTVRCAAILAHRSSQSLGHIPGILSFTSPPFNDFMLTKGAPTPRAHFSLIVSFFGNKSTEMTHFIAKSAEMPLNP